jgi:glycerate kinase
MRVVIAPDSFKGSLEADSVAARIAEGWREVRPDDELVLLPQADGGEGTLDAIASTGVAEVRTVQVGPPPHRARWLLTADGTAVIELAECCGLPLLGRDHPLTASTRAVGQAVVAALDTGADRIQIAIGGSASTDGGSGCLIELGLVVLDRDGRPVDDGGGPLATAATVDAAALRPPPPGGVQLLCDVTAPLFGPAGAAYVFGPQKGADQDQVDELDRALRHWHTLVGGAADAPGAGAAGGIAYGLASLWGAELVSGAVAVAELTGLAAAVATADAVITGEGSFDSQSSTGKIPGHVLDLAGDRTKIVIAGRVSVDLPAVTRYALVDLAGSAEASMADPSRWLVDAGRRAAREVAAG